MTESSVEKCVLAPDQRKPASTFTSESDEITFFLTIKKRCSKKQFLVSKEITMLHHPSYLPDLAPCNFFLFPKLKGILKGTCFQGVEDIKTSVVRHLKAITKVEFTQCFKSVVKKNGKVHQSQWGIF